MGKSRDVDELPMGVQATFLRWKDGIAVKAAMIPNGRQSRQRRTYFRHRELILDLLGVDISKTIGEQMGELATVKYNGEYLLRRDSPVAQGFFAGVLRPA